MIKEPEIAVETYPVRLRSRGQITLPQTVRERLDVSDGDFLLLVEVGDLFFITPKPLQVPRLADKIADLLDESGVSLADLLQGLEEERAAIWKERNG
ncbi:MAG: AbrB/MazE/SpoVT family DNA-binding domain-containing protein [Chloroflexota bacterium]|nr:AbrB/MazE/SpoVT family DNA-binding domain-containing protein [Chloroflexota bacterium]